MNFLDPSMLISLPIICNKCVGDGMIEQKHTTSCSACSGSGKSMRSNHCKICHGKKLIKDYINVPCTKCNGYGYIQ